MKLREIEKILFDFAPFELKEEWDNVGIMVGNRDFDISKILLSLDCTGKVIDEAIREKAELIVTHHPFIFDPIRNIDLESPQGKNIEKLIKNNISVISMHTNLDKTKGGVNDTLLETLGVKDVKMLTDCEYSLGRYGILEREMPLKGFIDIVAKKLNVPFIKYTGKDEKMIKKVACVSGAGSDFIMDAKNIDADLFITSEIKHHLGILANELDFAVADCGHFETENVVLKSLEKLLKDKTDLEIIKTKEFTKVFKGI